MESEEKGRVLGMGFSFPSMIIFRAESNLSEK